MLGDFSIVVDREFSLLGVDGIWERGSPLGGIASISLANHRDSKSVQGPVCPFDEVFSAGRT